MSVSQIYMSLLLGYLSEKPFPSVSPCVNSSDLLSGFSVAEYSCLINLETISWFELTMGRVSQYNQDELIS